jgi:hypothetical protein
MKSGSACRTSTATDSSTRMGQDEPRAVFEQRSECYVARDDGIFEWLVEEL